MCELPRVYCCLEHRDEKSTTLSLISHLSRAYTEALTLLKRQLRITKECRNNRADHISLPRSQEDEEERVDNTLTVLQRVIEEFNKTTSDNSMQPKEPDPVKTESELLKSNTDFSDVDNSLIISVNEEELLKSPVLLNRQPKLKKPVPVIISESTICGEQNEPCASPNSLFKSGEQDKINDTSHQENDNKQSISVLDCSINSDVVQCTPVQKSYKRMGLSKLYNVDTTISRTGKKLRQSKLFLEPFKENLDVSQCQTPKTAAQTPVKTKNTCNMGKIGNTNDENQSNVDEIIENSPQRSMSYSTIKSRSKLSFDQNAARSKVVKTLYNDDDDGLKPQRKDVEKEPLKETNPASFSQFSPLLSSTQFDPCSSSKRSNQEDCDLSSTLVSSPAANKSEKRINAKRKEVSPLLYHINELETDGDKSNRAKRKILEPEPVPLNDDTYFAPTPINTKDSASATKRSDYTNNEDSTYLQTMSGRRTPLTSYDRPPPKITKKGNSLLKSKKSKEEKAKLEGIDCWECQKYFNQGGMTNAQIKARLKACSRHRSKFVTRQSSPEGLWDAGFPDTQSSTMGE